MNNTLTGIEGVSVGHGHAVDTDMLTGNTLVIFDDKFPAALYVHGRAPAISGVGLGAADTEYYTDALFISGGSRRGVDSTAEALGKALEESGRYNPAVSGAGIYDLGRLARQEFRVDTMAAFERASTEPVPAGTIGAGRGASVGKFHYLNDGNEIGAMAGGVGNARNDRGRLTVCALSVVNALGNIVGRDGQVLAGNRDGAGGFRTFDGLSRFVTEENTIISIVGFNFASSRVNLANIARMASHGQIRATDPSGTSLDGDAVLVFSNQQHDEVLTPVGKTFAEGDWFDVRTDVVGSLAARVVQDSVYDAIEHAQTLSFRHAYEGVVPSAQDYDSLPG